MRIHPTARHIAVIIAALFVLSHEALAADSDPGVEFFEKRIRPILVEHCAECHSAKMKVKGGLRLDHRAGWVQGGDSGPAIVPGKPEESLLIEVLRHEGDLKMPPKGKLPAAVIRDFEQWVMMGAVAPVDREDNSGKQAAGIDIETGRRHWAYQPVASPAVPDVEDRDGSLTDVDRFILSRAESLESAREAPQSETEIARSKLTRRNSIVAPQASREKLIRRLYFDLVGLPPTPNEVDEFVRDQSPDAWERLVDRLLASPQFGERWARHWFDVVRFAESLTLRGFILKEAWRYRDYVIDAFNRDLPYDQFLREQLAGDLLPSDELAVRQRRLVATTVVMLGNTNLEEQDKAQLEMDLVDEQLDLIGRGFLAQTITCARCHDHKFDPIPTRDYYALAGILKNTRALEHENVSKWIEVPIPLAPDEEAVFKLHELQLARLEERLDDAMKELQRATGGASAANGVLAVKDLPGVVIDDSQAKKVGQWQASQTVKPYIGDGYLHDIDSGKGTKTLTFTAELPEPGTYEVRLAYTPGTNRAEKVPVTVFSADGEKTIHIDERKAPPIDGRFVSLGEHQFEKSGQSFVIVATEQTKGHVIADAVQFLRSGGDQASKTSIGEMASNAAEEVARKSAVDESREKVKQLRTEIQTHNTDGPRRPKVMTVVEKESPGDLRVHVRGSVHNLGPVVPRGMLQVATAGESASVPPQESGRRQLADWIASPRNPLTARVIVNRTWHWLFGSGLVRTTDNFGTTGETPTHPELLDHLAATFMQDGWSIKGLIRRIVTSRTYRLAVADSTGALAVDPENRLFVRRNRRRLDAEALRDSILFVSGDLQSGNVGPTYPASLAADYGFVDTIPHRSVYVPVFRNALPELFEVFDFADPSLVTGQRSSSTVAPQALFLLNHPFVHDQAHRAAIRLLAEAHPDDDSRLTAAYLNCIGRPPTSAERSLTHDHLRAMPHDTENDRIAQWTSIFHALFTTLDFRYIE